MIPDYFQQKAVYKNKKDTAFVVSKRFQDFIDSVPKTYEPKARTANQNGTVQSSN